MPISNRITTSRCPLLQARASAASSSRAQAYHGDPQRPIRTAAQGPSTRQSGVSPTWTSLLLLPPRAQHRRPTAAGSASPPTAHRSPLGQAKQVYCFYHSPPLSGSSPSPIASRGAQLSAPQPLRFHSSATPRRNGSRDPTTLPGGPAPAASTSEFPGNSQSPGQGRAHPGSAPQEERTGMEEGVGRETPLGSPAAQSRVEPTAAASTSRTAKVQDVVGDAETDRRQLDESAVDGSGGMDADGLASAQPNKVPLPLPAPGEGEGESATTTTIEVNGKAVILDKLGPMIVGRDGTLSRIANWGEMTAIERQNTLRILGKRNQLRLGALKAAAAEAEASKKQQ